MTTQDKPEKFARWLISQGSKPADYMRFRRIFQELDRKGVQDLNQLTNSFRSEVFDVLKDFNRRKKRRFEL